MELKYECTMFINRKVTKPDPNICSIQIFLQWMALSQASMWMSYVT